MDYIQRASKLFKMNDFIYRLPFYTFVLIYIWKIKKFPYFMYYDYYKKEKIFRQVVMSFIGIKSIDVIFNIYLIIKS